MYAPFFVSDDSTNRICCRSRMLDNAVAPGCAAAVLGMALREGEAWMELQRTYL